MKRNALSILLLTISLGAAAQGYQADEIQTFNMTKAGIKPRNYSGIAHLDGSRYALVSDKEDSDKLSDEEVDGLLEIEGRKEFFRLFLKYVLGSDGDVDMRKATYRHYGNVSPNADLESVERLFHSAWRASDATLNSDIVNQFAEKAEAYTEEAMFAVSRGLSLGFILNLAILILKLCGVIQWSWLIVIPVVLVISVIPFIGSRRGEVLGVHSIRTRAIPQNGRDARRANRLPYVAHGIIRNECRGCRSEQRLERKEVKSEVPF